MFINLLRIAIIFFTFGTVDILDSYTLYSIDNIVYEDLSYRDIFENDTDIITLPNGTKTFEISGNNLIQRVKKYSLQESDFYTLNTTEINLDYVYIPKISDFVFSSTSYSPAGYTYFEGYLGEKTYADNVDRIDYVITDASGIRWAIGVSKGKYNSLTEVKADLVDTIIYYQLESPIVLHTFNTAPTQSQLDEWANDYLNNKDNPSFEYTYKTLGIEHLILFITSMLFWYYSLKLLRKAVK